MSLAPLLLFVYNRPWHTRQTIEALLRNDLSAESQIIIFSDAAKNDETVPQVSAVRDYLKTITGFKSIDIVERNENWGLAKSIIQGVSDVINDYGKAIILEDDIVTSPSFIQYMNQALDFYENEDNIWHISGWNYPINNDDLGDIFVWRLMNCWGWATWADKWKFFNKDPRKLIDQWSDEEKYYFDLNGSGAAWRQVEDNFNGKINTWAVFWYATIYENKGLCVNPSISFVDNIGHDGTGVHCGNAGKHVPLKLNHKTSFVFKNDGFENKIAVERIKSYYNSQKKLFVVRVINKLTRMFFGRNIV